MIIKTAHPIIICSTYSRQKGRHTKLSTIGEFLWGKLVRHIVLPLRKGQWIYLHLKEGEWF